MARSVIWRRLAEEDLTDACVYLGFDSPVAAENLLDAIEDTVQFLLENPSAGRLRRFRSPRARGVRSYLIFYPIDAGNLEIVRFVHGARDIPSLLEEEP